LVLKFYVFWGIVALVLIGVAASVLATHRRNSRKKSKTAAAKSAVQVASGAIPAAIRSDAAFDPSATRILVRTAPATASSALLDRDAARLPEAASARLVCVGGSQKGNSFSVAATGLTVGRDPGNDVVIADPRVSSRHAWIGVIERTAILRDLGSTNGTFLNAQIDSPVSEAALRAGDTIFFGGHSRDQFRFVVD
jgi:hypothetical protein